MQSEFIKKFLEIERKLDLYNKTYNGFYYWLYYRSDFYDLLNQKINSISAGFVNKYKPLYVARCFINSFGNRFSISKQLSHHDTLVICHPRRIVVDNKYLSVYTDYFLDQLDDYIVIEYPYKLKHEGLNDRDNTICLDRLFWHEKIHSLIKSRFDRNEYNEIKSVIQLLDESIVKEYGIHISMERTLQQIIVLYRRYLFMKVRLSKILTRISPRIIVEVVSYNFENKIINELAHEMNIPIIELQHGLISEDHISYNYSCTTKITVFPDYLLVFGDYWKHRALYPIDISHLISVGFPHFEVEKAKKRISINSDKVGIIFISQGTIGKELSKVAYELSNLLDANKYNIIYKLHPGEFFSWKQNYPYLNNCDITVISNEIDLYDIFASCKYQIGVASTAIYEGVGFGLKTIIYTCSESIHVLDLCKSKLAVLAQNAKDIELIINKDEPINKDMKESVWKNHSVENIVHAINEISK